MTRALAIVSCLVALAIAAAMLISLWRISIEVRNQEMGILAGELRLALARAASNSPVDFEGLYELRRQLRTGDRDDLSHRLGAALPDYSDLETRLGQLLHERHPQLQARAVAFVSRVTLMDEGDLNQVTPVPLAGATTPISGAVTARHALFLDANGLALEIMFEAACTNVDAVLAPRLRPLRIGAVSLALLLIASLVVSLRAVVYSRSIGAYQRELIDTLAHELHTPLTTLHIGLRTLTTGLDESGAEIAERLQRQVRRLQRLTERVTVTSRALLHDGAPELAIQKADVEIRKLLAERFPEELESDTLQLQLGAPGACILADRADLEVVVGNLVENALKFSAGALSARASPQKVLVTTHCQQDWLLISVDDNGPGLEGKLPQRLAHPFRRGSQAASGLGLGLYLCHRIARRMGGKLRPASSKLGGACLRVSVPVFRRGGE